TWNKVDYCEEEFVGDSDDMPPEFQSKMFALRSFDVEDEGTMPKL
ncbi:unnamed protein product, partial [Colias eurytheme]